MSRIASIVRNLIPMNPAEFATPINWWSNGERGHLHSSTTCEKVRRSATPTVSHTLTITEAHSRRLCDECSWGTMNFTEAQRDLLRVAEDLNSISMRAEQVAGAHAGALDAYPNLQSSSRRSKLRELRAELGALPDASGLHDWRRRIDNFLSELTPAAPAQHLVEHEMLRLATTTVLARELERGTSDPSLWGGEDILEFFGEIQYRDWAKDRTDRNQLAWFAQECLRHVALGEDLEVLAARLLADHENLANLLADPSADRFKHCTNLEPPRAEEDLKSYSKRMWTRHAAELFIRVADHWSDRVRSMTSPAARVLIANADMDSSRSYRPHEELVTVEAAQPIKVSDTRSTRAALRVHPTVAVMLSAGGRSGGYGYREWTAPIVLADDVRDETIETALSLWEPYDRYSTYNQFPEAWAAATALT